MRLVCKSWYALAPLERVALHPRSSLCPDSLPPLLCGAKFIRIPLSKDAELEERLCAALLPDLPVDEILWQVSNSDHLTVLHERLGTLTSLRTLSVVPGPGANNALMHPLIAPTVEALPSLSSIQLRSFYFTHLEINAICSAVKSGTLRSLSITRSSISLDLIFQLLEAIQASTTLTDLTLHCDNYVSDATRIFELCGQATTLISLNLTSALEFRSTRCQGSALRDLSFLTNLSGGFAAAVRSLAHLTKLKVLSITDALSDEESLALANILEKQQLRIESLQLRVRGLEDLSRGIFQCPSLRKLHVTFTTENAAAVGAVLRSPSCQIRELTVAEESADVVSISAWNEIAEGIFDNRTLQRIEFPSNASYSTAFLINLSKSFADANRSVHLSINLCRAAPKDVRAFFCYLKPAASLRSLDLVHEHDYSNVSEEVASIMSEPGNRLVALSCESRLQTRSTEDVATPLARQLAHDRNMTSLTLKGLSLAKKACSVFASSLRTNKALRTLDLTECQGSRELVYIAKALEENTSITSVRLPKPEGPGAAAKLEEFDALAQRLKTAKGLIIPR